MLHAPALRSRKDLNDAEAVQTEYRCCTGCSGGNTGCLDGVGCRVD